MKKKTPILAIIFTGILLSVGCGQIAQNDVSVTLSTALAATPLAGYPAVPSLAPIPTTKYFPSQIPTLTPISPISYNYSYDKKEHTFVLTQQITPKEGMPLMLVSISGTLNEKNYWLEGNRLSIIDIDTGQTLQSSSREEHEEPFIVTTASDFFAEHDPTQFHPYDAFPDIIVEDLNFDGWLDFRLVFDTGAKNYFYRYWLWNPDANIFEHSVELKKLYISNPIFLQNEKIILSLFRDSSTSFIEDIYSYTNGVPMLIEQHEVYRDQTKDVMVNILRKMVNGELIIVEKYETYN